ncbi:hypothetical protein GCM10010232_49100 [Streptomyces amakusaensis]
MEAWEDCGWDRLICRVADAWRPFLTERQPDGPGTDVHGIALAAARRSGSTRTVCRMLLAGAAGLATAGAYDDATVWAEEALQTARVAGQSRRRRQQPCDSSPTYPSWTGTAGVSAVPETDGRRTMPPPAGGAAATPQAGTGRRSRIKTLRLPSPSAEPALSRAHRAAPAVPNPQNQPLPAAGTRRGRSDRRARLKSPSGIAERRFGHSSRGPVPCRARVDGCDRGA